MFKGGKIRAIEKEIMVAIKIKDNAFKRLLQAVTDNSNDKQKEEKSNGYTVRSE